MFPVVLSVGLTVTLMWQENFEDCSSVIIAKMAIECLNTMLSLRPTAECFEVFDFNACMLKSLLNPVDGQDLLDYFGNESTDHMVVWEREGNLKTLHLSIRRASEKKELKSLDEFLQECVNTPLDDLTRRMYYMGGDTPAIDLATFGVDEDGKLAIIFRQNKFRTKPGSTRKLPILQAVKRGKPQLEKALKGEFCHVPPLTLMSHP